MAEGLKPCQDDAVDEWAAAVLEHRAWLRRLIAARLDPGEPVDDVLQETIRSAIADGAPGEGPGDVKGWLGGIARNKVRQFIDRKGRDRRLEERVSAQQDVSANPPRDEGPDAILLRRERVGIVAAALGQLGAAEAALLRRKYFDHWTYAQIGAELGVNHDAVANRLREARQHLRAATATLLEEG